VQILANALPGFRDLRGPVIAGYLWLVFAWLIVEPDVHHRPSGGVGATAWDLADDVGRFGVAVGVSVAAYLIGSLSLGAVEYLIEHFGDFPDLPGSKSVAERARYTTSSFEALLVEAEDVVRGGALPSESTPDGLMESLRGRRARRRSRRWRSCACPPRCMVSDQPLLYAEVDRL